jgi:transcriptional regulator with XRE-family HTH domain
MTPRIRLKDIAEKAGLSVAAVSMALKDHRSLPASTIKKVKALAKKWVMLRTLHFQHLQLTGVDSCERYLKEIEEEVTEPDDRIDYHAWRYQEGLHERIAETRAVISQFRKTLK